MDRFDVTIPYGAGTVCERDNDCYIPAELIRAGPV